MDFLWHFIRTTLELAAVKPELNEIINLQLPTLWAWREVYYNFHKQQAEGANRQEQAWDMGVLRYGRGLTTTLWTELATSEKLWNHRGPTASENENWDKVIWRERKKHFENVGGIKVRENKVRGTTDVISLFSAFPFHNANFSIQVLQLQSPTTSLHLPAAEWCFIPVITFFQVLSLAK